MPDITYAKGLEGVIAGETSISKIDGENGHLWYRGYSIEELSAKLDFEAVTWLLLNGELPHSSELAEFSKKMRTGRALSPKVIGMIRDFPQSAHPMELLQSVIAWLSGTVEHTIHHGPHCNCRNTLHQVAQLPPVIAALHRLRNGQSVLESRPDLGHGANFLWLLRGTEPSPLEAKIMDTAFVLHAEHGFNASTFTARVVASTMSTCYASIASAIGALYGSLHGGANEEVMKMVEGFTTVESVAPYVHEHIEHHEKIMGVGHRVYKTKDPRASIMEAMLKDLSAEKNDWHYHQVLKELEQVVNSVMEAKGKKIYPNVDFFSGAVYRLLGIPGYLFTPIFAAARAPGWLAHILEQRSDNKLFRPKALYVGSAPRPIPEET